MCRLATYTGGVLLRAKMNGKKVEYGNIAS